MDELGTVAQVVGSFGGGGAERLAYNLALGLREIGVASLAVSVRRPGGYAAECGGVEVVSLDAEPRSAWSCLRAMWRLRRLVRVRGIHVVHVHGSNVLPLVEMSLRGMHSRPKLLFTWHDSGSVLENGGWRGWATAAAVRRCDRVFGSSAGIVERLQRTTGRGDVTVFRNGVPMVEQSEAVDADEPVVLWMARFEPEKDPAILIRVVARLRDEGLKFRVIMAGAPYPRRQAFFDECKRLVRDLNLEGIISFPGWVGDTAALIRSASIGVQTSHSEGLSMTLLEQMMAGLAVVATDVGDTREAVNDGETGIRIPVGDEGALAVAIRALLADRELRTRLGTAARRQAMATFTMQAMAAAAWSQYEGLMTTGGRSVLLPAAVN